MILYYLFVSELHQKFVFRGKRTRDSVDWKNYNYLNRTSLINDRSQMRHVINADNESEYPVCLRRLFVRAALFAGNLRIDEE